MRNALLLLATLLVLGGCKKEEKPEQVEKGLYYALVPRLTDSDRKVEIYWTQPVRGTPKPWPVVIYVHGDQETELLGGKNFYEWGVLQKASRLGYLAVAVSLPGYGKSSGPPDFSGPDSQQALQDVIRVLRRREEVEEKKIALVGVSRGAAVVAKVGEQVSGIAGLVLISGFYELGDNYRAWKIRRDSRQNRALAEAFEAESEMSQAGPVEMVLRERSVLPSPQIRSPILVLHGAKDPLMLPLQAEELVSRLKEKGIDATAVIYPEAGHQIPVEAREKEIEPFLKRVLGK